MSVKVTDNLLSFVRNNAQIFDGALSRMANDIKIISSIRVPFKKGDLQKSGEVRRKGLMKYKVVYNKSYAGYQEKGQRASGSHKVRKYTTPNTGKGYLKGAGEIIKKDSVNFLKQAAQRVKA